MNSILQLLRRIKTKLKFHQNISNYYDEVNIRRQNGNFQFEEDPFSKHVEGLSKIYPEVPLLMKFLQTKSQVRVMNIKYCGFYFIVLINWNEKEIVCDGNEKKENDYIISNDYFYS